MYRYRIAMVAGLMMAMCACSSEKSGDAAKITDEVENIRLDAIGFEGEWSLDSYVIGSEVAQFEENSKYSLAFDEAENTFGILTNCNTIGGMFGIGNDTIRFYNVGVTEMSCDEMAVEEAMLKLLNDSAVYALCHGDSLVLCAPAEGSALFVRKTEVGE